MESFAAPTYEVRTKKSPIALDITMKLIHRKEKADKLQPFDIFFDSQEQTKSQ